jgi:hypothetical protein
MHLTMRGLPACHVQARLVFRLRVNSAGFPALILFFAIRFAQLLEYDQIVPLLGLRAKR